ncbi:MAG: DUF885 family protein [Proteobacteria bacterium]|nr:DUF885 family protein [Pseudomonadota bacterium]
MLDRRELLAGAGATAAALGVSAGAGAAHAQTVSEMADGLLDQMLKKQFEDNIDRNPELATQLGLDKGARAKLKSKLDDRGLAAADKQLEIINKRVDELDTVDGKLLSKKGAINYDVAKFRLVTSQDLAKRFHWGAGGGRAAPYVVSQLTGAYYSVPDFLANAHKIEARDDADAYLARLKAFGTALDQETEQVRHDAGLGVVPPDFVLAKTIGNLKVLRDEPAAKSVLVRSLADRAKAKGLGDYEGQASQVFASTVVPALDRQISALQALQPKAVHDAGVWRLPDGDAYYNAAILSNTTVNFKGDQVHALGLEQVKDLQAQMEPLLQAQGLTQGSIGDRVAKLNADARYVYPNTDEGKAELIAYLNQVIAEVTPKLPRAFTTVPTAKLEIKRVPAYIESGAPLGYYNRAPLDGSRPGIYYINLKDTADWPKWALPTLCYHEGVPGHHFQISLASQIPDLPIYRRTGIFSAYVEGWALYSEQLADEMGMYDKDPLGRIGMLQALLFRAVRLVVDSGIHSKRWSREQAIKYMMDNCGRTEGASINEVERYCVQPGQACSYKMGHILITKLRDSVQARLGNKFDLKGYHDAVLNQGALPLALLERVVNDWASRKAAYG